MPQGGVVITYPVCFVLTHLAHYSLVQAFGVGLLFFATLHLFIILRAGLCCHPPTCHYTACFRAGLCCHPPTCHTACFRARLCCHPPYCIYTLPAWPPFSFTLTAGVERGPCRIQRVLLIPLKIQPIWWSLTRLCRRPWDSVGGASFRLQRR